ncbi:hypothetical protein [Actinophytocola sp.]|uniref:hypothetical protein n=1 Tax=Actinophytocola sp. TaxID=1872138 RepID=UPI002D7ED199|nr:hypothetical protein [Actinophytocola sp.]HET9144032.1 hypothetical protein [Actinophytocola sp.]
MAARIRFISGPQVTTDLDVNRRRTGRDRVVMLVQVGESKAPREVELTEHDLLNLIAKSADMLEVHRRRREAGLSPLGSGEVTSPGDVGRIPGDL